MVPADAARRFPLELLAPARDADVARAAIDHGADAVYIGGPGFGARVAAGNSLDDLAQLAAWAKNYHARVYMTLNTVLFNEELAEAVRLAWQAYDAGVDALIIQDMGLLTEELPPLEIHASTQCDIRTPEKAAFLDNLGFNQIVLARELTLEEIRRCREAMARARIEFFVHGALCVSYSGRCYLSCAETGRSANRGACAQPCRLPYSVFDRDGRELAHRKHVLSLMDNDQSGNLEALVDAGVTSFKIEGRLKDAAYVKNITAYYRQKLDDLIRRRQADGWHSESLGNTTFTFTPDPCRTFHRGATDYFVNGRRPMIAQLATPKSTGETVGRVVKLASHPAAVTVKTQTELANGDGLVYLDANEELQGLAVNRAEVNVNGTTTIYLRESLARHPHLAVGTMLNRNKDRLFAKVLEGTTSRRLIPVAFKLTARTDCLTLEAAAAAYHASVERPFAVQAAKNADRARETLANALTKTGDTVFEAAGVTIDASALGDDAVPFVPMSAANDLRRQVLEQLSAAVRAGHAHGVRHPALDGNSSSETTLDFRGNVANEKAVAFWKSHGVIRIESAAEADPAPLQTTDSLMHTRHCIRWTLGLCPRQTKGDEAAKERFKAMNGGHLKPEPLFLVDDKGRRLVARFDCKACEMHIGWAGDEFPRVLS